MRALWIAAPLALTRYAAVLAAVLLAAALAAGAAASSPFVRAGVKSSSLRGDVGAMSKYAAGLSIVSTQNAVRTDPARRAAALRFGRGLRFAGPPVLTSMFPAVVKGASGTGESVYVMARTNATAHADPLSGSGKGAWVSIVAAKGAHLHAGGTITLSEYSFRGAPAPVARLPIARIYQALDTKVAFDGYWANFVREIVASDPDAGEPPTFVFVSEQTLLRLARQLHMPTVDNRFEYPVDTTHLTYVGATQLVQTYSSLREQLTRPGTHVGRALGCGRPGFVILGQPASCTVSSSLDSALLLASSDVSALSATIWLLSACALGIALLIAAAAGIFLVRRRRDEAHLLFARGERSSAYATRTALECLLPVAVGGAVGLGTAFLALRVAAPAGTLDSGTKWIGVRDAGLACVAALALIAAAAAAAFPRRSDAQHPLLRRLRRVPWEVLPLAGAGVVLGVLLSGGGIAHSANGEAHPSLPVFLLPALAAPGFAGFAARAARRAMRSVPGRVPLILFFSARRVAAARGLLIAVIVAAATALSVFAYATSLSSSVSRGIAEKAFVANGSDVQGVVDPTERIYDPLPFPAVIVEVDSENAFSSPGHPVDIVAGDLAQIRRVIRWGPWSDDPRAAIPRLERATAPPDVLPVIASPDLPNIDSIVAQGVRVPIRIVARKPFPGMSGGRAAILISRAVLRRVAAAHHILDPGPFAGGLIWARGNPKQIEEKLTASNIHPAYLTTFEVIRGDPSVRTGKRSYGYLRTIGGGAVLLALLALLLYLQARQRDQVIAGALLRRMGRKPGADTAAVALEAAAIVALAFFVGLAVAVIATHVVVPHVDPLPQYAPGAVLVVPWIELFAVGAAAAATAALLAAALVWVASRADASEALRVA